MDEGRRSEDKAWRERTEDRIVSLTNSETVQNDRLDEHDDELKEVKNVIDHPKTGIIHDIEELQTTLRRFVQIMDPDLTGNKGLIGEFRDLVKGDRRQDRWWKGLTPIVVAIVTSTALVLTNLDRIAPYLAEIGIHIKSAPEPAPKKTSKRNGNRHRSHIPEPAVEAAPDQEDNKGE